MNKKSDRKPRFTWTIGDFHITKKDGEELPVKKDKALKQHNGVAIALKPSLDIANKLSVEGGEQAKDLHVTIAYLGNTDKIKDKQQVLQSITSQLASVSKPLSATIGGVTRFTDTHLEDKDAVVLNIDIPELPEYRQAIVETLERLGFPVMRNHGYTPHMTVAYVDKDGVVDVETPGPQKINFDKLWLFFGGEHKSYPMVGEGIKSPPHTKLSSETKENNNNATKLTKSVSMFDWQYNLQKKLQHPEQYKKE